MDTSGDGIVDDNFMPICEEKLRVISPVLKALVAQHVSPGAIQLVVDALSELNLGTLELAKSTNLGADKVFMKEFADVPSDVYKESAGYPVTVVATEITKLRSIPVQKKIAPKKIAQTIRHPLAGKNTPGFASDMRGEVAGLADPQSQSTDVVGTGISGDDGFTSSQVSDRGRYAKREVYLTTQQSKKTTETNR